MKLIREEIESVDFIVEERNGKKSMYIEGIFLQGDIQNRNGRMYPIDTLRKEVQRYNESNIVTGRALGELGHPDGPTVNLDRVSHKIVSLKENGSNFIGKAKILNTPMGNIAKNLIKIEQKWLNNIKNDYLETKQIPPYNQLDIDSLVNQINQDTSK